MVEPWEKFARPSRTQRVCASLLWREEDEYIFTSAKRKLVFMGGLNSSSYYTFAGSCGFSKSSDLPRDTRTMGYSQKSALCFVRGGCGGQFQRDYLR